MANYKVAAFREQGQDIIVVAVNTMFGTRSDAEQREFIAAMQEQAHSVGLKGTVVPAWQVGGILQFVAPKLWHPFFRGLTWNDILRNVNYTLCVS